jgi:hypothetical protein
MLERNSGDRACQERFALLYDGRPGSVELSSLGQSQTATVALAPSRSPMFSLSCGLSGSLTALSEHLSSSSLPPSFAPERRTTVFLPPGASLRGARFRSRAGQ